MTDFETNVVCAAK